VLPVPHRPGGTGDLSHVSTDVLTHDSTDDLTPDSTDDREGGPA
jgi:hypothetical protein